MFAPFRLRDMELANRVVVSPMATYSAKSGVPDDFHLVHYGKFAMGGAGLVFVEATGVLREGRITNGCLGLWSDAHRDALARIATTLKSHGAVPAIQIGRVRRSRLACCSRMRSITRPCRRSAAGRALRGTAAAEGPPSGGRGHGQRVTAKAGFSKHIYQVVGKGFHQGQRLSARATVCLL